MPDSRPGSVPDVPSLFTPVALIAVMITVGSWGLAFPAIRVALDGMAPLPLASARFALAALVAIGWLAIRRPPLPSRADLLRFAVCGGLGIALYNILLNSGQQTVAAGAASFIANVAPVITVILAVLFLKERFRALAWAGMALSMTGVGVIATGQPGGLRFGSGAMLVLGAAFTTASYFVLQRPLVRRHGALNASAITLLFGALWLLPWLPDGVAQAMTAERRVQAALLFLALLPAAIGYGAWAIVLGHFGAARAANFLYLVPVVASLAAVPLVGEVPGWTTLLGGGLALAGVAMVNRRP
ncbi:DMT family transporter [Niveispirillum irakense]|uniref:DMT family transporter n=1 Tax=Niveispirillum irakense TaxID=34011 RepID=UPI0003FBB846|nr:DMT family transporter [Niveispirillum irakense]